MSTKRQPSKQRRQSQNRAERAALERRRQNALAGTAPAGKVGAPPTTSTSKGSVLGRLTGASRGGAAAGSGTGRGGGMPTGYRAALTALLMAGVGVIFAVTLKAPVDQQGELFGTRDDKTADFAEAALREAVADPDASPAELVESIDWQPAGSESYVVAAFPLSLAIVLPLGAAGLAFWSVRKGATSRVVNRCMYASLFGALLTQSLAIMFLPAAIAIGVAGFQLKKEEVAAAAAAGPPAGDGDGDGDDDLDEEHVIEVDEVEVVDTTADEVEVVDTTADEVDVLVTDDDALDEPPR